jgi:Flp pilus assembly protein CpaB
LFFFFAKESMKPRILLFALCTGCLWGTASLDCPSPTKECVNLLVAKHQIAMGTLIREPQEFFTQVCVAKTEKLTDCVHDYAELKGKRIVRPFEAGEPVRKDDFLKSGSADNQKYAGLLAIELKVSEPDGDLLNIYRSRMVDIIVENRDANGKRQRLLYLRNVIRVSVDSQSPPENATEPLIYVGLSSNDAERLAQAQQQGKLRLVPVPEKAEGQ